VVVNVDTAAVVDLTVQGTLAFSGTSTLKVSGNFTLDGSATFTPGTGTVELTGSGSQTLTATAPGTLTFYNLTLNKDASSDVVTATSTLTVANQLTLTIGTLVSASDYVDILIEADGTLELTDDITIAGNLEVQAGGTLTTAGYKLTFDGGVAQNLTLAELVQFDDLTVSAGTTLVETDPANNVLVNGTLLNEGTIRKTQVLDAGEYYYFGLAGNYASADLEIRVTDRSGGDPLTAIQVDRMDANHPQAPGTNTTSIYWTITPTGADFVVNLVLPQDDLPDPQVSRYRSSAWDWGRSAFDPNTVTRTGLTAFGDFAVFNEPKWGTTTTLGSSLNPAIVGDSVTFTATVSPSAASGAVTFKEGATTVGSGTLSGGVATYTTSGLTEGAHPITAEYGGDTAYVGSSSVALTQTVNPVPTAARLDYFRARSAGGAVTLTWQTLVEYDVLGFVVEREGASGWERVNGQMIPSRGGDLRPHVYECSDAGAGVRYRLLEVDLRGRTRVVAEAPVQLAGALAVTVEGESLRIEWLGAAGEVGVLEASRDAVRGPWATVGEIGEDAPVLRALSPKEPVRFFRVRSDP
jgi:hypothetical protein